MTIVEYQGKKYDTGFEFETVRANANTIKCKCFKYVDLPNITEREREDLWNIASQMADLGQAFEMVNDLPLTLETQERLLVLMKEIDEKYEQKVSA